eukprot:GHVN01098945.1.p3 GENE.GHVN01098945.1~~GHVN01098945.1.p3  ORF type:complete len:108 (+),score=3.32 GHVN01098945.1:338-661(+)
MPRDAGCASAGKKNLRHPSAQTSDAVTPAESTRKTQPDARPASVNAQQLSVQETHAAHMASGRIETVVCCVNVYVLPSNAQARRTANTDTRKTQMDACCASVNSALP